MLYYKLSSNLNFFFSKTSSLIGFYTVTSLEFLNYLNFIMFQLINLHIILLFLKKQFLMHYCYKYYLFLNYLMLQGLLNYV